MKTDRRRITGRGSTSRTVGCAALAILLSAACASAQTRYWDAGGGADRDWSNPTNWSGNVEPTSGDIAHLGHASYANPAVAEVTQSGEVCSQVRMGYAGGQTGVLTVISGDLSSSGILYCGNAGGAGILNVFGGTLTFSSLSLAAGSGASVGMVTQTAGRAVFGAVTMGATSANRARYVMTGGTLTNSGTFTVGDAGFGEFIQTGGTNIVGDSTGNDVLDIGSAASGTGVYHVGESARLIAANPSVNSSLKVGTSGNGSLFIGGGTVEAASRFIVRTAAEGSGLVQGWGTIAAANLVMHGRVIADGYGLDRTLSWTDPGGQVKLAAAVTNFPYGTNGWYAQNGGKLVLHPIAIKTSSTFYWGETGGGVDFDLVNAASVTISGFSSSGGAETNILGAFYAADRSDVPAWAPSSKIIGIWRFMTNGFTFSSMTVTCRYDHAAAAAKGIAESDLKFFSNAGGIGSPWTPLTTSVDTNNRWIAVSGISGTPFLAVGSGITSPPPVSAGTTMLIR